MANNLQRHSASFWHIVFANKMNFLNALQSRKLQLPIAKQSNLIKRIAKSCKCVGVFVCVLRLWCGRACVTRADSNLFCLVCKRFNWIRSHFSGWRKSLISLSNVGLPPASPALSWLLIAQTVPTLWFMRELAHLVMCTPQLAWLAVRTPDRPNHIWESFKFNNLLEKL